MYGLLAPAGDALRQDERFYASGQLSSTAA